MSSVMRTASAERPRIRVMILGLRGFPDVQGGVEKHVEQLAPLLVEFGCAVDVIVRAPYVAAGTREWRGVSFRRVWAPRSRRFEAIIHTALGVLLAAISRPDILHIHAIGPALLAPLARLFGLRVVVTHHGCDYERAKWGRFAKAMLKLGERAGLVFAHGRIAVSRVLAGDMERRYQLPVTAIPNAVSLPAIPATMEALRTFGLEPRRYVLTVGRFVPEKRHLDLISAFSQANIPGWKLAIVGGADHADSYSREVKEQTDRNSGVVLTGVQTGTPLAELFAHAGAFVLPSSHEGLPIALLEALSYGLPCIASDIPANRELDLGQSRYFPVGDCERLKDQLIAIMHEPFSHSNQTAQRIGIANHHNCEQFARRTLHVYREALDAGGSLGMRRLRSTTRSSA